MLIECLPLKEKIIICNKLGEIARDYISSLGDTNKTDLDFYREVLRCTMKNINDSPTLELDDNTSTISDETLQSTQPVLIDNILFRTAYHAYCYYATQQNNRMLAKILAEDNSRNLKHLLFKNNIDTCKVKNDLAIKNAIMKLVQEQM